MEHLQRAIDIACRLQGRGQANSGIAFQKGKRQEKAGDELAGHIPAQRKFAAVQAAANLQIELLSRRFFPGDPLPDKEIPIGIERARGQPSPAPKARPAAQRERERQ